MFPRRPAVIGMIHVLALPGTPRAREPIARIVETAVREARIYEEHGLDGLLIENMHDVPYLSGRVGPEIVAGMTAVGAAVRAASMLPLGVQILAAANCEALAVAHGCGATFVRVENFTYAHVADEGIMPEAAAGPLLRYRRQIAAEAIRIVADVKKKHSSHAITADVTLAEAARTAEFCGADGLIVTGVATGDAPPLAQVRDVRQAVRIPVMIGSGVTAENIAEFWPHVDAAIVGSHFKHDGVWSESVDARRVADFMRVVQDLRPSTAGRPAGASHSSGSAGR